MLLLLLLAIELTCCAADDELAAAAAAARSAAGCLCRVRPAARRHLDDQVAEGRNRPGAYTPRTADGDAEGCNRLADDLLLQGFYDPIKDRLIEPSHTGISYSFTEDGYFEEAQYRAIANRESTLTTIQVTWDFKGRRTKKRRFLYSTKPSLSERDDAVPAWDLRDQA